jgi:superfamily I DNA/RNA helicase
MAFLLTVSSAQETTIRTVKAFVSEKPIQLNSYQKKVVDFRAGYAVVQAAPGSGKTACIVQRVQSLIREGVHPKDILSLTFTKEGAKEMTERADLECEEKVFSTFHSWALRFIKKEWQALPFKVKMDWHGNAAPLCLPPDACRTLALICKRLKGNVKWKDAQGFISKMKRRGISPAMALRNIEHEGEEVFVEAYRKYDHALREKGQMDFDSIVIETANLLKNREDVRARNQFRFVQVDEAQDTDEIQASVIQGITEKYGNCIFVGDINQNMYTWRGAVGDLEAHVLSLFPSAKTIPLAINYRSTQSIVDYCKEIAPTQNESVTLLTTPNAKGVAPVFKLFEREDEEARGVILACQDLGNTAILARTNRQLAAFENECGERDLRYKLLGKSGFWGQNEVKDMLAIAGAVVMPTDNNILRMLTSRCEATKFLRKQDNHEHKSIPTLLKEAQNGQVEGTSISSMLTRFAASDPSQNDTVRNLGHMLSGLRAEVRSLDGTAGMRRIIDRFGVLSAYQDDDDDENIDNDPRDNIMKLVEFAGKRGGVKQFFDWALKVQRALRARTNCLTLSTIHQSKGKEWPYVFVVGVNVDVLPHVKGDPLEERRIFFVACSRAAKKLQVSASGVASDLIRHKLPDDGEGDTVVDPWDGYELLQ